MKYMVLIADTEEGWGHLDDDGQRALYQRISAWWDAHKATTIRVARDGNATVTDGPFIEGKEAVGGYAIIDVPDLDAAIKLVSGWPAPDILEIRPLVEAMG